MGDQQFAETTEVMIPDGTLEPPGLAPKLALELARLDGVFVPRTLSQTDTY